MQVVHELLRPAYSKRWNQNTPAPRSSLPYYLSKSSTSSIHRLMVAVTICRFHNDFVRSSRRNRITNNCEPRTTYVPRENQPFCDTALNTIDNYGCRSEDVTCIYVATSHAWNNIERFVIGDRYH